MQEHNKKKKNLKVKFDMIQSDKDFYLANCNFTDIQEKVFKDLTSKYPMSIIEISMNENISESTVNRIIRKIKLKMIQAIITK